MGTSCGRAVSSSKTRRNGGQDSVRLALHSPCARCIASERPNRHEPVPIIKRSRGVEGTIGTSRDGGLALGWRSPDIAAVPRPRYEGDAVAAGGRRSLTTYRFLCTGIAKSGTEQYLDPQLTHRDPRIGSAEPYELLNHGGTRRAGDIVPISHSCCGR